MGGIVALLWNPGSLVLEPPRKSLPRTRVKRDKEKGPCEGLDSIRELHREA